MQVDAVFSPRYGARSMTSEFETPSTSRNRRRSSSVPGALSILTTRFVLFWEDFWPAILPALAIPYILGIISLFGLWQFVPAWLHWSTLALAIAVLGNMLWRDARHLRFPSRRNAQARLEEDGHTFHTPLQALDDMPFQSENTGTLWKAHQRASRIRARNARLAGIRPTADNRDPFALRFTALGLLAVAFVAAGNNWQDRLQLTLRPAKLVLLLTKLPIYGLNRRNIPVRHRSI